MLAEGFSTRRGRRAALVHRDEVNGIVRGRRGSRLLAQTSGGAIPEIADYPRHPRSRRHLHRHAERGLRDRVERRRRLSARQRLVADPAGDGGHGAGGGRERGAAEHPVLAGRGAGAKRRAVARGERSARARSIGASTTVSRRRDDMADGRNGLGQRSGATRQSPTSPTAAASLGVIPSQETFVLERFFDESGGMQLVLHAPFGSRVNKAWGLALRKRFCRQFNFELQAAATEDGLMLSLGPQHSFPLADVFRYLHPETTRDVLVQALPRRAGVRDAVALERDAVARRAAPSRRAEGRAAGPADAGRRSPGVGVSRRRGLPREHSRRPRDAGSSARQSDGPRLPRRSHGPRRAERRPGAHSRAAS